ncbi:MAG: phosphotransferase enzyme family protein [Egibacteraceae bacterium]
MAHALLLPAPGPGVRAGRRSLPALMRRWPVGEATGFRPLTEGLMNRNYRIDTQAGPFFLKQFLDIGRKQIAFQHRVTAALAAAGLPIPAPIPARDGRTLVTVRGQRFSLYPWVSGSHRKGLDMALAQCAELGRLLGRLHAELGAVLGPIQQTLLLPTAHAADTLVLIEELLSVLRAQPAQDDFDDLAEQRMVERRSLLAQRADQRPPDCGTLTVGYVHGDFHALNLLYAGDELVAILDWDRLSVRPYTQELVRAATLFFGYGDERGLDLSRVRAFADAYREVFFLDGEQIRSAVRRLWWERLNDFWMLKWRYQRGDRSCDHLFPGAAALVEWWTERYDEALDAFASP